MKYRHHRTLIRLQTLVAGVTSTVIAVVVVACSSVPASNVSTMRSGKPQGLLVRLAGVSNSDTSYVLSLVVYDERQRIMPQQAIAVVDGDTLVFSLAGSGAPGNASTRSYTAGVEHVSPDRVQAGSLRAELTVETSAGTWHDTIDVSLSYAMSLALEPFAIYHADGVDVGCMAHRLLPRPDEFLPSSETFRLSIRDRSGTVLYRSDDGMAFLQVITPVEPRMVGEHQRYSIMWRGTSSSGQQVPDGVYTAEMTIPAVPLSYTATMEISWPPR